jgi:predicted neutral ceramidase superfamily lipid hydrolase
MIWNIALIEFKLQRRSLIYWVVLILLLWFLVVACLLPANVPSHQSGSVLNVAAPCAVRSSSHAGRGHLKLD